MIDTLKDFLIPNLILLLHAMPDFAVWFGIAKENNNWKHRVVFRVCKAIYDFPITFVVALLLIRWELVMWFYILKWAHGADSWYNIFSKWCGKQANWNGYWRSWSIPFGLFRNHISYHENLGGWRGTLILNKGNVTRTEGYLSTLIFEILFIIFLVVEKWLLRGF